MARLAVILAFLFPVVGAFADTCDVVGAELSKEDDFTEAYALAKSLSKVWHRTMWVGIRPYSDHYDQVEGVLTEFGFAPGTGARSNRLHVATRLHDVIEDTDTTLPQLEALFARNITRLVDAVTEVKSRNRYEPVLNELARRATYEKILSDPDGVVLKLADRIANMRSYHGDGKSPQHYVDLYPEFRKALYREGQADAMWKELDRLVANSPRLARERSK